MGRAELHIEVVYCPAPGVTELQSLLMAPGARLLDAVQASGLPARHGLEVQTLRVGVWGRLQAADSLLRDHDRVEIYRPLTVDPKEARRQRYKQHLDKLARR